MSSDLISLVTLKITYFNSLNLFNMSIVHYKDNLFLVCFRQFKNKCYNSITDIIDKDNFKPYHKNHPWSSYWKDLTKEQCKLNTIKYINEEILAGGDGSSYDSSTRTFFALIVIEENIKIIKQYINYLIYEDTRLYKDINNKLYAYGLKYIDENSNNVGRLFRIEIEILDSDSDINFINEIKLCNQTNKIEKNWMFDINNNIYNIPYPKFLPIQIYSITNNLPNICSDNGIIEFTSFFENYNKLYDNNKKIIRFSGGTPLITLPNSKQIFVGHIVVDHKKLDYTNTNPLIQKNLELFKNHPKDTPFKNEKYKYHHYEFIYYMLFIEINNNKITRLSKPFAIFFKENTGINFPTGLTLFNEQLLLTFGESDYLSNISIIDINELENNLYTLDYFSADYNLFDFTEINLNNHNPKINYYQKYIKYKNKYIGLKNL
jgi:hypothetical protein